MKKQITILFLLIATSIFSQRITGKILDFETKMPIVKAHVFFKNKILYTNDKGEFSFKLNKIEGSNFTISHIKYQTKNIDYKKEETPLIIYLQEKLEVLDEIKISLNKKLKNGLDFKKLQDLPIAVYSFASILKDDKIYVFGGDASNMVEKNKAGLAQLQTSTEDEIMKFLKRPKPISFNKFVGSIQEFSLTDKEWTLNKDKLIKRAHIRAVLNQQEIYLLGGKKHSKKKVRELLENNIEIISTKDFSVRKDATNPHQAVDFGALLHDNKIVVFGGSTRLYDNGRKKYSDDIHLYDLESGYWYVLTKMSKGKEVNGVIFDNKLYLFGGFNGKKLSEIESYNLKTGKWEKEGNLFRGLKNPAITKDKDFIYLYEDGKFTTFNPKKRVLKEYKIDLNLEDLGMHFLNEQIYLIGGFQVEEFRKFPSKGFYSLNVLEFFNTRPINVKKI